MRVSIGTARGIAEELFAPHNRKNDEHEPQYVDGAAVPVELTEGVSDEQFVRNEVEALGSVLGGDPKAAVRVDPRGCAILYGARTKQIGEYSVLVGAEGAAQRCDRGLGFGE